MLPNSDDLRVAGLLQVGGQPSFRDDPMESILKRQVQKLSGWFSYLELTSQIGPRPLPLETLPILGPAPHQKFFLSFGH